MVHGGVAAAGDWIDGDALAFESRMHQATASDAFVFVFVFDQAVRPRR